MFFKKSRRNQLKMLVKDGDLANLQSIVENGDASTTTDSLGMTMLHLAVKYDKRDVIKYLLTSRKIDIDAQDSSGTTPLVMALREKNIGAARLLIDADARIDIANAKGKTPLTYVVQYRLMKSTDRVFSKFREKFFAIAREPGPKTLTMYRSVSLESALTLDSAVFMKQALRSRDSISYSESHSLVFKAMFSQICSENLRVLLNEGPGVAERRKIFLKEISHLVELHDDPFYGAIRVDFMQMLVYQLIEWNMLEGKLIAYCKRIFHEGEVTAMDILLVSGVVEQVKRLRGVDLMAHLFANKNHKVMQILQGRELNVDAQGESGLRALHFAARANSPANVRFLLSKGANVNALDDLGMTPLFDVVSARLFSILTANGADVQVISDEGLAVFEFNNSFDGILEYFLGYIVLMETRKVPISQEIREKIQSSERFKSRYEKYHSYIDQMKKYVVCDRVSMYTILVKHPRDFEKFMRSKRKACKEIIERFPLWSELLYKNVYYHSSLKRNTKLALEMCKFKNKAMEMVAESIPLFEADHLIVQKIVGFLNHRDLRTIFKESSAQCI